MELLKKGIVGLDLPCTLPDSLITGMNYPKIEQSLYDARFEHDNCGVGFVADSNGVPDRRVLDSPRTYAGEQTAFVKHFERVF